jgi:2'-5' RNA ligase
MVVQGKCWYNLWSYKAVVIIPPETVWSPLQAIRQQHNRQVRRWIPHITLLYSFRPRDTFATVAPALEAACAGIVPFGVTLAQFYSFAQAQGRYTLWLVPEPAAALVELQTALWQVVPDCDEYPALPVWLYPAPERWSDART